MSAKTLPARVQIESSETENDRFKRSFESWLWGSMIAATVLHFMLFQFWPMLTDLWRVLKQPLHHSLERLAATMCVWDQGDVGE